MGCGASNSGDAYAAGSDSTPLSPTGLNKEEAAQRLVELGEVRTICNTRFLL